MKKIIILISIVMLAWSAQAVSGNNAKSAPASAHSEQVNANATYESVRKAYTQGKISADKVVDKALAYKASNPELAERCLRIVSDNNTRAMAELGFLYTFFKTAYLFPGKTDEGVKLLNQAAQAGSKDASDYLGIYYSGLNDYAKAKQYFDKAAPDNSPLALTVIGGMYDEGKAYKKDAAKAKEYYKRAAMQGNATGAGKYGMALQRVKYGKVDMPEAFKWLYIAGDLGDDFSRSNLNLPLRGERFGDDIHTALVRRAFATSDVWNSKYGKQFTDTPLYIEGFKAGLPGYEAAGEHGDDWTLFFLGSMSYNDEFLNRNGDFILKCYGAVAQNKRLPDEVMALVYERLGKMYRNGEGVKSDPAAAAKYERLATEARENNTK